MGVIIHVDNSALALPPLQIVRVVCCVLQGRSWGPWSAGALVTLMCGGPWGGGRLVLVHFAVGALLGGPLLFCPGVGIVLGRGHWVLYPSVLPGSVGGATVSWYY